VKLFDIRTEISQFIESDFLVYSPEAGLDYYQDRRHTHKSLAVYKFVASSKIKLICQALKERFQHRFDRYDVRIVNDDYVHRIPERYNGVFYGAGCDSTLRWGICLAMPLLLPLVVHEMINRHEYEVGFVYRIKRKALEQLQHTLVTAAQRASEEGGFSLSGTMSRVMPMTDTTGDEED
jgi:hypothetical protein